MLASAFVSRADAFRLVRGDANQLESGGYMWNPSLAPDGSMSMVVDLTTQRAFVYRGGTLIGVTMIASGKRGYETPRGTFTVLEKERYHHSNKYDNAPMPFMQRLTWFGLALHGGHPHGRPASHGCIRLPMGFAAALFGEDTQGMPVVIEGYASSRPRTVTAARDFERTTVERDDTNPQPDELRTKDLNEQSYANGPEPAGRDETEDQTYNRYVSPNPGQGQNEEPDNSQDQNDEDIYRSEQPPPPPDLPPPPG